MTEAPITFKTVTLCDKAWVDEIVRAENSPSADYNFGNIYIWDKRYRQLIARCGDRMLTKLRYEGQPAFVFPIGSGPLRPAIEALRDFAAWRGYPLVIRGITDGHRAMLEAEYPGCFTYALEENNLDYIYRAEKLATYAGQGPARQEEPLQPLRGRARLGLRAPDAGADPRLPGHAGRLDRG